MALRLRPVPAAGHRAPATRAVLGDVVEAQDAFGVAARPDPVGPLGEQPQRRRQGAAAATTLLAGPDPDRAPRPFAAVPSFWSDPHGARIRPVGPPGVAGETRVVEHDPAGRRIVLHRAGRSER
ncbi:hypothetical protein GCM10010293_31270 [Streptomyces griseoflavus]|nr:hypothetical protein GCM10010293_31270 [Streptomyces griseoflavus]